MKRPSTRERIAKGLCLRCGGERDPSSTCHCLQCLIDSRERVKRWTARKLAGLPMVKAPPKLVVVEGPPRLVFPPMDAAVFAEKLARWDARNAEMMGGAE